MSNAQVVFNPLHAHLAGSFANESLKRHEAAIDLAEM
jgi:hypothetical protein